MWVYVCREISMNVLVCWRQVDGRVTKVLFVSKHLSCVV